MACTGCFHEKEVHDKEKLYCQGDIMCQCIAYQEPPNEFILRITDTISHFNSTEEKVFYILEKIPSLRNAGSKSFPSAYKKIVYGLKQNDAIPRGLWKTIPADDTINRCKRKVQQFNPGLAKFDIEKIRDDVAVQQGVLEWCTGQ